MHAAQGRSQSVCLRLTIAIALLLTVSSLLVAQIWNARPIWKRPCLTGRTVYSPDGSLLAATEGYAAIGLYRVSDGALLRTINTGHTDYLACLALSPDGTLLASGSEDNTVKVWQVSDGTLVRTLTGHTGSVYSVAFSPSGMLLVTGSTDATVKLWSVGDGALLYTLTGHTGAVKAVSFSPDGLTIASGGMDHLIKLWRTADGALLRTLTGHTGTVWSVAFAPDGTMLASAGGYLDNTVKLWTVSSGALLRTLTGHADVVKSVAFSPNGALLASGSEDKTARIWRASDGALVRTLTGHAWSIYSVDFSPDGSTLATGSTDYTVRLWRVSDGALQRTVVGPITGVKSVAYAPGGLTLAVGTAGGAIHLINAADGSVVRTLAGHTGNVWSVAYSPDGAIIASGSTDATIKCWRASDGALLRTLSGHAGAVKAIAFSPNGALLASGGADQTVRLWQAGTGARLRILSGHTGEVYAVAFSPNSALIASGSADQTVKLWRASDGAPLGILAGHADDVRAVAFSPDGATLASAGWTLDKTVKLWRVSDGTLLRSLTGHTRGVAALDFTPDGQWLVSGGDDTHLKFWRAGDGTLVNTIGGQTLGISAICVNAKGTEVATGGFDGLKGRRAPAPQPDLLVRKAGDLTSLGENLYGVVKGQTCFQTVTGGTAATYILTLQNDGNFDDRFTVTVPAAPAGWSVRYFDAPVGGADITALVAGAGWTTPTLAPGLYLEWRAEVTPDAATSGSILTLPVSAASGIDAAKTDVVGLDTRPTLAGVTLVGNPASPVLYGTPVTLTAAPIGGGAVQYLYKVYVGGVWTVLRNYAGDPTCSWTPATPGACLLAVYAREQGTSTVVYKTLSYQVSAQPSSVTLAGSLASPTATGIKLTFMATQTGGTFVQYRFLLTAGTTTTVLREWGTGASCAWTPLTSGDYQVEVRARAMGSTVESTATATVGYTIKPAVSAIALKAVPASPVVPGTPVTLTATPTGGVTLTYSFHLFDGVAWSILSDRSAANTCVWTPTLNGTCTVQVRVYEAGSVKSWDAARSLSFKVAPPITDLTVSGTPSSPIAVGTTVHITAQATGGTTPQYRFLVYNGNVLVRYSGWSTMSTYDWTPTAKGVWTLYVRVRESGSTAAYALYRSLKYSVN